MNSYLEILFWTITVYIIAVAIVHFIKVLKEKKENNTDLIKAIIYLAGGIMLAVLLVYKPFGANIGKIANILGKRPISSAAETVMIASTAMGPTSVSV